MSDIKIRPWGCVISEIYLSNTILPYLVTIIDRLMAVYVVPRHDASIIASGTRFRRAYGRTEVPPVCKVDHVDSR